MEFYPQKNAIHIQSPVSGNMVYEVKGYIQVEDMRILPVVSVTKKKN
jgi:hypothetical protein